MAALTYKNLDRVGFGLGTTFEAYDSAVTSGYKAYLIPDDARESVVVSVKVNTAANYNVEYSISPKAKIIAGTQVLKDAFGAAQTTSKDVEIPAIVSFVVVTFNSGTSIDIEVRAK